MKYNPGVHHRRSIRLKGYDYSCAGAYLVTICTRGRECLFGEMVNEDVVLNGMGRMVKTWYLKLPNKFPDIKCDEHVVMPNHIHAIIQNVGTDQGELVGADPRVCPDNEQGERTGSPLPRVIQWFKTMTTNAYIRGVRQNQHLSFPIKLWQRDYYEHIVRNENALNRIRGYIRNNPLQWELDRENPNGRKHAKKKNRELG
ncbi:MAG: hypothetical protein IEMM0002_1103 [bacterium]|nr:MAG: hypothetical protein IEMM0002_1103 [bacterium]